MAMPSFSFPNFAQVERDIREAARMSNEKQDAMLAELRKQTVLLAQLLAATIALHESREINPEVTRNERNGKHNGHGKTA